MNAERHTAFFLTAGDPFVLHSPLVVAFFSLPRFRYMSASPEVEIVIFQHLQIVGVSLLRSLSVGKYLI